MRNKSEVKALGVPVSDKKEDGQLQYERIDVINIFENKEFMKILERDGGVGQKDIWGKDRRDLMQRPSYENI